MSPTPARVARSLNEDARDIVLLVNRTAGAGRRRERVAHCTKALEQEGFRVHTISQLGELADKVVEIGEPNLRLVVAAGGDGTFAAALNNVPPGTPLAALPLGTENLLARYARHRAHPDSLVKLAEQGVVVPLDAGRAADKLFTIVLSAGFDAHVIHRVHDARRGHITHLAYAQPILAAMASYRFPKVRAIATTSDGQQFQAEGKWAFAANLPSYAQQIPIVHEAVGTDGQLDLCLFGRGSVASGFWYFWHVLRKRHRHLPSVTMARFERLRLEPTTDEQVPFQIDGDPAGFLPVDIEVVPARLPLVVMPEVAKKWHVALPTRPATLTSGRD